MNSFRWTQPRAAAKLYRPHGTGAFDPGIISPDLRRDIGYTAVEPWPDRQTARRGRAPVPAGEAAVEFQADPVVEGKSQ